MKQFLKDMIGAIVLLLVAVGIIGYLSYEMIAGIIPFSWPMALAATGLAVLIGICIYLVNQERKSMRNTTLNSKD